MSAAKAHPPRYKKPVAPASHSAPRAIHLGWLATNQALAWGVAASVATHSLLFALGFVMPDSGLRKEHDKGLQVVLVNARHQRAPRDAQALAQANLDGGGEQDKKDLMPTSPLPPQNTARDGDALVETQQKLHQLEALQRELLARSKASDTSVGHENQSRREDSPADTPQPKGGLDMNTARAIARQEAVVERGVSDYAARPKKGFISPRTKEYKLAQYGEDWRIKVQRVGELNFPRGARGSLYGSVLVSVEIRPDGSISNAEIVRPDRDPKINEAALRIVKLASPYAPFPPDILKEYDILVLTRTMNFTREDINVNSQ
ncbi:MAG: conserved hypothetical secreted protein [Proteobacteria bacterium]|nr:conserved hypothetical secreted protein [Pseudomonadota bacterium]